MVLNLSEMEERRDFETLKVSHLNLGSDSGFRVAITHEFES